MTTLFYVWCVFAIATAGLALFRKFVAHHEDDYLHVGAGQEKAVQNQMTMAHKLSTIDRLGRIATLVTAICGVALVAAFLLQAWVADGGRVNMR